MQRGRERLDVDEVAADLVRAQLVEVLAQAAADPRVKRRALDGNFSGQRTVHPLVRAVRGQQVAVRSKRFKPAAVVRVRRDVEFRAAPGRQPRLDPAEAQLGGQRLREEIVGQREPARRVRFPVERPGHAVGGAHVERQRRRIRDRLVDEDASRRHVAIEPLVCLQFSLPIRHDAVDVRARARARADGDVRVGGKKPAQLRVGEHAREDHAQRGVRPRIIVFVEPEVAECAGLFFPFERETGLHRQRAAMFNIHLSPRSMRQRQNQNDKRDLLHDCLVELPRHSRFKPAAKKFRGYKVLAVEIRFSL